MPEEHSATGRWLRRITDTFSGEPRDVEELNEVLAQARERGIINPDAFEMLEGVLQVIELQVRDIMVARSQMTIVNRDDPPEEIRGRGMPLVGIIPRTTLIFMSACSTTIEVMPMASSRANGSLARTAVRIPR